MALLTLAVFSVAAGVLILCAFKVASNQRALQVARRRLRSHLLAMRLFRDDPGVIVRSQGRLLEWTARYMALLLPAFLLVAIPLFFAWDYLDAVWGRAPWSAGDTAMVTARLRENVQRAELVAPAWLAVETPPVHVLAEHEVSWRLRVRQAASGEVSVSAGGGRASTNIEARPGLHYLPDRATTASGPIEWVEVRYPRANLAVMGVSANWAVWFCLISTVSALALRSKLRVTF